MEKYIDVVTIDNTESNRQRRKLEAQKIKNLQIRNNAKKKVKRCLVYLSFLGSIYGAVWSFHQHAVNEAAREALSGAGLNMLDNGWLADSDMTKDELIAYVDKHNITIEELSNAVGRNLKWDGLYSEDTMEKVERLNSEVFEEARENSRRTK